MVSEQGVLCKYSRDKQSVRKHMHGAAAPALEQYQFLTHLAQRGPFNGTILSAYIPISEE